MRYLLIDRHRRKYIPVISVGDKDKNILPGPGKDDKSSTPWVSLFFKSAFWYVVCIYTYFVRFDFLLVFFTQFFFTQNFIGVNLWFISQ